MSAYEEQLAELLALARQALHAVQDVSGEARGPYAEALERLERVLGYGIVLLEATEPELLSDGVRSDVIAYLNQLVADPPAPAQAADQLADNLLAALARLPVARDHEFAQQAREAAANYQRSVQQRLHALDGQFDDAHAKIEAIAAEADERRAAVGTEIDAVGSSFDAKLAELEQEIAAQETRIEQSATTQAETFRSAQNDRDEAFKETVEKARADVAHALEDARTDVEKRVAEIRRMGKETADLVGAIGLAGTAKGYGDEVKEQRKAADTWRWLTILFGALAAVAVIVVVLTLGHDPQWEEFLGKLAASLLFGGLAGYSAGQSARHRAREERARNFQLELTAFGPFIEPLSDEQKEEERVIMTRKTFGKANTEISADEEPGPQPISFVLRRKERDATEIP